MSGRDSSWVFDYRKAFNILKARSRRLFASAATLASTALSSNFNYHATLCHYRSATRLSFDWLLACAVCAVCASVGGWTFAMTKSHAIASKLNLLIFWQKVITINDWNRHLNRHHDNDY